MTPPRPTTRLMLEPIVRSQPHVQTTETVADFTTKLCNKVDEMLEHENITHMDFLKVLRDANVQRQAQVFTQCRDCGLVDSSNEVAGEVGEVCELTNALLSIVESNRLANAAGQLANTTKKIKRDLPPLQPHPGPYDSTAEMVDAEMPYLTRRAELQRRLEDEIADVLITLDLLAARASIDLAKVVTKKFNEVSANRGSTVLL